MREDDRGVSDRRGSKDVWRLVKELFVWISAEDVDKKVDVGLLAITIEGL